MKTKDAERMKMQKKTTTHETSSHLTRRHITASTTTAESSMQDEAPLFDTSDFLDTNKNTHHHPSPSQSPSTESPTYITVFKQTSESASPVLGRPISSNTQIKQQQEPRASCSSNVSSFFSERNHPFPQQSQQLLPSLFTDETLEPLRSIPMLHSLSPSRSRYPSLVDTNGTPSVSLGTPTTDGITAGVEDKGITHGRNKRRESQIQACSPLLKRAAGRTAKRPLAVVDHSSEEMDPTKKSKRVRRSSTATISPVVESPMHASPMAERHALKPVTGASVGRAKGKRGRKRQTPTEDNHVNRSADALNHLISTPTPGSSSDEDPTCLTSETAVLTATPSTPILKAATASPSAALSGFQFVTDRVFKPLFSSFASATGTATRSSSQDNRPQQDENTATPVPSDTTKDPPIYNANPFLPSPSSFLSLSRRYGQKRTATSIPITQTIDPLVSERTESRTADPRKLTLLQKFPNFLSSSSNGLSFFPSKSRDQKVTHSFNELPDLISEDVGGKIIFATDEFFASAENLLKATNPERRDGESTPFGTWYDGWLTQRRRNDGHDWCLIALGLPGVVHGVEVNTGYLNGNHAPRFSIEAAYIPDLDEWVRDTLMESQCPSYQSGKLGVSQSVEAVKAVNELLCEQTQRDPRQWRDLVEILELSPGENYVPPQQQFHVVTHPPFEDEAIETTQIRQNLRPQNTGSHRPGLTPSHPPNVITHIRLNIFPDGGMSRLKVYGCGMDMGGAIHRESENLAAVANGALVLACSSKAGGDPRDLLLDTVPRSLRPGWVTARNPERAPILKRDALTGVVDNLIGEEWVTIRLAGRRTVTQLEIDTTQCIGNHPDSVEVTGIDLTDVSFDDLDKQRERLGQPRSTMCHGTSAWAVLLTRTQLGPEPHHVWYQQNSSNNNNINTNNNNIKNHHNDSRRPVRSSKSNPHQQVDTGSRRRDVPAVEHQDSTTTKTTTRDSGDMHKHHSNISRSEIQSDNTLLNDIGPVTHLRITIYPDGGISRVRVFGRRP